MKIQALVRAADGFGVAIGRAAVLGAAEHDCGMITALSGPAAASSLRVGDRIVAVNGLFGDASQIANECMAAVQQWGTAAATLEMTILRQRRRPLRQVGDPAAASC